MIDPLPIRVRNALTAINGPDGVNIVASGIVQGLNVNDDGHVRFTLEMPAGSSNPEEFLTQAKAAAERVNGVSKVSVVATAHSAAPTAPPRPTGGHDNPFGMRKKPQIEEAAESLAGVKHVIAIASGKGGVGKSTLAANLAIAFARSGKRTGFLDADIYGPSAPTLFGVHEKARTRDGKIIPAEAHGVRIMSVGMIVDPDQALAWRGPMVMGALKQLMRDVEWGELDVLIVDTPPGTGDAHLSLIQSKQLTGAVIVSTPQEMALADVRRGIALLRKTETPVLGVVENMAWLEMPGGDKQFLFGEGGAKKAAAELAAPFLGTVPLFRDLRIASDSGKPPDADHPAAKIFANLATKILAAIA